MVTETVIEDNEYLVLCILGHSEEGHQFDSADLDREYLIEWSVSDPTILSVTRAVESGSTAKVTALGRPGNAQVIAKVAKKGKLGKNTIRFNVIVEPSEPTTFEIVASQPHKKEGDTEQAQ